MKKTKIFSMVLMLAMVIGIFQPIVTINAATDFGLDLFNTADLFEENAFMPGFDIWSNQSVSTTPSALLKYGLAAYEQGWVLRHILIVPPTENVEWEIQEGVELIRGNYIRTAGGDDVNDPGYSSFTSRDTSPKAAYDQMEVGNDAGTVLDLDVYHMDTATIYPTSTNYTQPDSDPIPMGIEYGAGDGKSINDYAEDLAEADGETFYDVANCSMIGFSFDQHDDLVNTQIAFDEEVITSAYVDGQLTFQSSVLTRHRVWLHQRECKTKWWIIPDSNTILNSVFMPIGTGSASLPGVPVGAKHYYSKPVNPSYYGDRVATMPKATLPSGEEVDLEAVNPTEDSYTITARRRGKLGVFALMRGIKKVAIGLLILTPLLLFGIIVLIVLWKKGKLKPKKN